VRRSSPSIYLDGAAKMLKDCENMTNLGATDTGSRSSPRESSRSLLTWADAENRLIEMENRSADSET
jgi:hypothetical protein